MKKPVAMESLIRFKLHDDCIEAGKHFFHFYRYYPPNLDIMTAEEISQEEDQLAALLDALARPVCFFATDKIEDLSQIKSFYAGLDPRFDAFTSEIIASIESADVKSAAVQRAFYIVTETDTAQDNVYNIIAGKGYRIQTAVKQELAILLRNYFLREFIATDIYTLEEELLQDPKLKKRVQKHPQVLDSEIERRLTPHRIDFHVNYAVMNGIRRKTLMVKNMPRLIPDHALKEIATLRGTSFALRLAPMSGSEVRKMTNAQVKQSRWKMGKREATEQMDANNEQHSLLQFYNSISNSQTVVFYTSIYIEAYGSTEDEVNLITSNVIDKLGRIDISAEQLVREQKEAFLCVNPLGRDLYLPEANNLPARTVAALYPFSYSSRLDIHGMFLGCTELGGAFFLDLLRRFSDLTNSNFTIIGAAGQGKSWLLKKIIAFLRMFGVTCFTLDPENEYGMLFRKLGGTVFNCVNGAARINPLEGRCLRRADEDGEDEDLPELANMTMFFQHLSWLKDFFKVLLPGLDDEKAAALMVLTQEMYATKGITTASNFETMRETDYPTLTDLYKYIEAYDYESSRIITKQIVSYLLLRLRECYDGHTNIKNADMICFSVQELLEGSKDRTQAVLFNLTTWIWNQVMKRERSIAFNMDELYLFLENPIMVRYICSFNKRDRKYNAMMGVSTQQLADCLRPDIATYTTALFNNSTYQFLFHPGEIDMDLVRDKLKLKAGEISKISSPNRGHCLVKAGEDRYYVKIGALAYEKELFGKAGGQ